MNRQRLRVQCWLSHIRLVEKLQAALLSLVCIVPAGLAFGSGAQFKFDDEFAMPISYGIPMILLWAAAGVGVAVGLKFGLGRFGLSLAGATAVLALYYSVVLYNGQGYLGADQQLAHTWATCFGPLTIFLGTAMGRLGNRYRWNSLLLAVGACVAVIGLTIGAIALTGSMSRSNPLKSPLVSMSPLALAAFACIVYTFWPRRKGTVYSTLSANEDRRRTVR